MQSTNHSKPDRKTSPLRSLLLAGVLPVLIFTVLEETRGVLEALVFAMIFGFLEILWEAFRYKKVETLTWIGNTILLVMGGISLVTQEGIWFKLQPAFLEAGMGVGLIGSCLVKKPFLNLMAAKQGLFDNFSDRIKPLVKERFSKMSYRFGFFFLGHAALATYAAFYWSTRNWALLKGVGVTVSMILFSLVEIYFFRKALSDVR